VATEYSNRLTMIVPANRVPALNAWFKNNIDIGSTLDNITVPLNVSGDETDVPSHYWFSGVFTDSQMDLFLGRLIQQANVIPPDDWNSRSRQQKKDWVASVKQSVIDKIGVRIFITDNIDGSITDNLDQILVEHGVKRRQKPH
jgi:hypothetical protein